MEKMIGRNSISIQRETIHILQALERNEIRHNSDGINNANKQFEYFFFIIQRVDDTSFQLFSLLHVGLSHQPNIKSFFFYFECLRTIEREENSNYFAKDVDNNWVRLETTHITSKVPSETISNQCYHLSNEKCAGEWQHFKTKYTTHSRFFDSWNWQPDNVALSIGSEFWFVYFTTIEHSVTTFYCPSPRVSFRTVWAKLHA